MANNKNQANKNQARIQQVTSALLFAAIIVSLGWLSTRFKLEADWTSGNRNTLTEASRKQLEAMPDPIRFIAFVYPSADIRRELESRIQRYQRFKKDVSLDFIDPATQPQKIKEYNVSASGEVVVEYQGRRENLRAISEQTVTTALQRLSSSGERWVVFLEGHGEHSIDDQEQGGYAKFVQDLRDKGIKVRTLNLATDPRVPDNASVLVIAAPGKVLLDGEQKLVIDYLNAGGNLLWLADPENEPGAPKLAETLGINWLKGTGIMLESAALQLPPFVYVATRYPPNPVTKDFGENVLLPLVRGLTARTDAGWNVQPLLTTGEEAWLETASLDGEIALDEGKGDTKGPLTIAATLTRNAETAEAVKPAEGEPASDKDRKETPRQQRVAVVGDSDFLSNAYYDQLGNSGLGLNLAQWLSSRDTQLNIDVPKAPDTALFLPPWLSMLIGIGFVLLLPLGLLGFGVMRWVMRRRR
jgi:ABC-type uncharacterized transport system involved in gliding motility auxiliary subunit